ncbi:retrovirus-related pol polyprotein from transposon TNT 1-94 [Tanacetum coccineum]
MITQPTDVPSGNNIKVSESVTESLIPNVTQTHISNQASISSYPFPQDRWSRDQHIKLVNIIGDPSEGMLTRSMAVKLTAALVSECLFADFLSEIEPKKVSEALKHPGWIDDMQEELNQFYRNKEEGIDYDETFAPVARMETIRIFLVFITYMNFKFYQIDLKSAFLNGKLKEEVYVKQPPGFESSEFPDYVCKLDKALYGLKHAPRAWYETFSTFLIQNKFTRGRIDNTLFFYKSKGDVLLIQVLQIKHDDKGISICQEQYTRNLLKKYEIPYRSSVKTPMVPPNNLGTDRAGKPVNETSYRGMIGSLMYLTAIRPDIQFSTILCARYQSNPKESHLTTVKRILMFLKGTLTLGLYYPKCSGFDLKGYSDSYYAGCNMDRKSTSVVYQNFLREFSSTVVAYDPFPSTNEMEQCPLREFLIKFLVLNRQRPLTLDFNTFYSSTGFDYNNGKYVAHPTPEASERFSVSTSFGKNPKKGKSQTVTPTLSKSQGPEVPGALFKKSKRPKSKKPPTKTKGTRKSQPLPESTATHPKDSGGNIQPLDRDLLSMTSGEGTAKTTPRPEGSLEDKDLGGNIPPADMEPIHPTVADLSGAIVKYLVDQTQSTRLSEEDILGASEEMDDEPQAASIAETHHQSPPPQADKPQSSHASSTEASNTDSSNDDILKKYDSILPLTKHQLVKYLRKMSNAMFAKITKDNWEKHGEVVVNYVGLKASIDDYYDENIAHRDHTDKLVEAFMSSFDKSSNTISDL